MAGFLERVGGIVVHPRRTMRELAHAREGGLVDASVVLGLHLLAGQTRVGSTAADSSLILARGLMWLPKLEPMLAIQGALQSLARLLPDMLAILVGSIVLALFAGRRTGGRELDLAAMAWVPAVLVKTAGALAFTLLGRDPSPGELRVLDVLALGWAAGCWALALWTLRNHRDEHPPEGA